MNRWTCILVAPALFGAILLTGCDDGGGTETVTLNLTVNSFEPGQAAAPVPNAEVCVFDAEDCATTDANGLAVVELSADTEVGLSITAAGFNPTVLAEYTGADFVFSDL